MQARAETGFLRRALFPSILTASLISSTFYYTKATVAVGNLAQSAEVNLLATIPQGVPTAAPAVSSISALAADPLDQETVNGVIGARARASGDTSLALRQVGLLRNLGWRSTSALKNLLWRGGITTDLPLLMDTIDALLRREQLLGQIYPILNMMTTDGAFRDRLTERLAGRPSWRRYYFMSASDLVAPEQIEGRYLVMRAIQHRGDRLTRNEVAPILPKLLGIGRGTEAFDLWRTQSGTATSPLTDTKFSLAGIPLPPESLPISFEWQLGSGSGYFTDAGRDDHGSFLSIDWNGRGAPVFASQITTARAGHYELDIVGDGSMNEVGKRLGFRLACANRPSTEFVREGLAPGARVRLVSSEGVSCDFPTLEIYGLVQSGANPGSIVFRSIRMARLGG